MMPKKPVPKRRPGPKVDALAKRRPTTEEEREILETMEPSKKSRSRTSPRASLSPVQASLALYRRIAFGFVFVVAAILVVVLYISTVEARIRITPVEQIVRTDFILDVVGTPTRESEVRGKVVSGAFGKTGTFTPSGEGKKEVDGVAKGKVTIYNTTANAQTLVKTTRLLTPEGVLFRIDSNVNVPAKGSVEANAYADQPGKTGDIAPAKFTIPGLPKDLQSVIYAESKEPFAGGLSTIAVVSEADITKAVAALKEKIEEEAKTQLRSEVSSAFSGESFSSEIAEQKVSVEAGVEAGSFEVALFLRVRGVFYDREALLAIATRKLFDLLEPGKEFKSMNTVGLQVVVERANEDENRANLRVYLDGIMIPSATSAALNPGRFMGMKEAEVRDTLVKEGVAKSVEIEFFPPFIHRIPRLKDHVYVEVLK